MDKYRVSFVMSMGEISYYVVYHIAIYYHLSISPFCQHALHLAQLHFLA